MDIGQLFMVVGIVAFLHSLFSMAFPGFSEKMFRSIRLKSLCSTKEKILKTAHWELFFSIVIFIIGMNI